MTSSSLALTSDKVRVMPGPVRDERADALRARYHAAFGDAELPVPVEAIAEDLLGLQVGESENLAVSGMLLRPERQIWLNAGEGAARRRFTLAHELGHAIDLTYNTAETRMEWMRLRRIDPATTWFGCDRCSDYNTPSGDFAETFALLLRGPKYFRSRIAALPTPEQIPALARLFPKEFLPPL